ncbi:MAG: hypothetical protein R2807_01825 [Chitinophagales bacterium]
MNANKETCSKSQRYNLRAQLITKGKERAKVFNWEQTADAFMPSYNNNYNAPIS